MSTTRRLRCAIYTRKSTDEGLDQDFNSLDAQREACEAFIASQRHEGWIGIGECYDDGGYSGGTLERPGVQRLLGDIKAGGIDVVVVYKIDRLTRALADFARLVEVFDAHAISFVAVTQQFNTTTSMGRLTLNVLLSFAQFEREVTAERIRDKIAASKKKGMWMGGLPPLGYDARDRKLVVNETEAETVHALYRLYLDLGSVREVATRATDLGLRTKSRIGPRGRATGGGPFTRGHLYRLLANPLYLGLVRHRGAVYEGQHAAIVDRSTWDAVQDRLAGRRHEGESRVRGHGESLLTGIVFDETGDRLSPTHAIKARRRYRYYISHRLMTGIRQDSDGWRLPAPQLEAAALGAVISLLQDRARLMRELGLASMAPGNINAILSRGEKLAAEISATGTAHRRDILLAFVERIDLSPGRLRLRLTKNAIATRLAISCDENLQGSLEIVVPFALRRRGVEGKLIVHGDDEQRSGPDQKLIEIVARGHDWFDQLAKERVQSVNEIAQRERVNAGDVSRLLSLAFIAPDIAAAIVDGRQPPELTANRLRQTLPLPGSWIEQRRLLGFPASNG